MSDEKKEMHLDLSGPAVAEALRLSDQYVQQSGLVPAVPDPATDDQRSSWLLTRSQTTATIALVILQSFQEAVARVNLEHAAFHELLQDQLKRNRLYPEKES